MTPRTIFIDDCKCGNPNCGKKRIIEAIKEGDPDKIANLLFEEGIDMDLVDDVRSGNTVLEIDESPAGSIIDELAAIVTLSMISKKIGQVTGKTPSGMPTGLLDILMGGRNFGGLSKMYGSFTKDPGEIRQTSMIEEALKADAEEMLFIKSTEPQRETDVLIGLTPEKNVIFIQKGFAFEEQDRSKFDPEVVAALDRSIKLATEREELTKKSQILTSEADSEESQLRVQEAELQDVIWMSYSQYYEAPGLTLVKNGNNVVLHQNGKKICDTQVEDAIAIFERQEALAKIREEIQAKRDEADNILQQGRGRKKVLTEAEGYAQDLLKKKAVGDPVMAPFVRKLLVGDADLRPNDDGTEIRFLVRQVVDIRDNVVPDYIRDGLALQLQGRNTLLQQTMDTDMDEEADIFKAIGIDVNSPVKLLDAPSESSIAALVDDATEGKEAPSASAENNGSTVVTEDSEVSLPK